MAKIIPGMVCPTPVAGKVNAASTPALAAIAEFDRQWDIMEKVKEAERIAALPPLTFADHLYPKVEQK